MKNVIALLLLTSLFFACGNEILPKPKSYLKLQYPAPSYSIIKSDCPYNFEISNLAHIDFVNDCWATIKYPQLKATIHITYRPVNNNLNEILMEVEKMTFEHTIKADVIIPIRPYEDFEKKVFGKLYNVEGNVATNIQFSVTDSLNHVLSGALYFYAKPNYDSIVPAIRYIEKDIVHLVETLTWKQQQ